MSLTVDGLPKGTTLDPEVKLKFRLEKVNLFLLLVLKDSKSAKMNFKSALFLSKNKTIISITIFRDERTPKMKRSVHSGNTMVQIGKFLTQSYNNHLENQF